MLTSGKVFYTNVQCFPMTELLPDFKKRLSAKVNDTTDYFDAIDILQAEMDALSREMIDLLAKRSIVMCELETVKHACMMPMKDRERQIFEKLDGIVDEKNKELEAIGCEPLDREEVRALMEPLVDFALEAEKRCPRP